MNLGETLKATKDRTVAETNRQRIEREAVTDMKKRHTLESVQLFFSHAREKIESDIRMGEVPPAIHIGKPGKPYAELVTVLAGYGMASLTAASPKHPYHFAWLEFATWARDNGLLAELRFEHDGVGRDSWYALVVKPA
jgi:hypothetical protein